MVVPEQMRAAIIRAHGGPVAICVETVPTPRPGPGELLVQVGAVGLNHLDVFAREGLKGPGVHPIRLPHVSGVDVAGVVVEGGPGAANPPLGARVLVYPSIGCGDCSYCKKGEPTMCSNYRILGEHLWGGLAEYVVVPARNVIPLPSFIPFVRAAAVPAAYTTAWRAIVTVGKVRPGERVLVVGASGGVGFAALQIATLAGAKVLATASTEAKRERARALGAVAVFDSSVPWVEQVLAWTGGGGVDLALDAVGAPTWRATISSLGMGGRMVICGATGGDNPAISIREIYQHHRQILGAPMGNWQDFLDVTRLVFEGELTPEVFAIYPLDEIAHAEQVLAERKHFGKLVIQVAADNFE